MLLFFFTCFQRKSPCYDRNNVCMDGTLDEEVILMIFDELEVQNTLVLVFVLFLRSKALFLYNAKLFLKFT